MFGTKNARAFRNLFLALLVALPAVMPAQERLQFSDTLQLGEFKGKAEYTYKIVDSDTVLDGAFKMHRSNLSALLEQKDTTFSFTGTFEEGYPVGAWKFLFGEFQSDSRTEVEGYQYKVNISGTQHEAAGSIRKGKPQGQWSFVVRRIDNSEIAETLFSSTIEFENGIPQKSFRIEDESRALIGRFLRNGLAHDVWTLYSGTEGDSSESWYFNEGRLVRIAIERDGQLQSIDVYPQPLERSKVISLDSGYGAILKHTVATSDSAHVRKSGIHQMLTANARKYREINTILTELGKSDFMPEFRVKVAYFPLDSVRSAELDTLALHFKQASEQSRSLLSNSQLNILRRSDPEAQFLYAVLSEFSTRFLDPLETLVDLYEQGVLENIEFDGLVAALWPEGQPTPRIRIATDSLGLDQKTFEGPGASQYKFKGNSLSAAALIAKYAAVSVDSIASVLEDKVVKERRQQDFVVLEERMISQINELNTILDSINRPLSISMKDALNAIRETAESGLKRYSAMAESSEKADFANALIHCIEQLQQLARVVGGLPDREEALMEKYRDDIWNPFTATIMEEEVKKRIITAYRRVLVPYFLDQVGTKLSCENTEDVRVLIGNTYDRMLELRDENTKKLERKLRKEQNPDLILQLFGIQPLNPSN